MKKKFENKEQGIDFRKLGLNELQDICRHNNIELAGNEDNREQLIKLIENDKL